MLHDAPPIRRTATMPALLLAAAALALPAGAAAADGAEPANDFTLEPPARPVFPLDADADDTPFAERDFYLQSDGATPEEDGPYYSAGAFERPNWYFRGGVNIVFPQDFDATFRDSEGGDVEVGNTLGWGGGLYTALGYTFGPNNSVRTRVEGEYQLRINDFRDDSFTVNDSITWNSVGGNVFVDFTPLPSRPNFRLYGGAGAGLAYITVSNPVGAGSDDSIAGYAQLLGGGLVRFNDDIDIDFGLRYQTSLGLDVFEGSDDLGNAVFHVGLLLYLE